LFDYAIFKMLLSRAGRVVIGIFLAVVAALVAMQGYMEHHVLTVSGKPVAVLTYTDQKTGAPLYDGLQLSEDSTIYKFHEKDFSPAVTPSALKGSASLDLWYTSSPLAGTWIIAVQMHDAKGHVVKATTPDYPQPADRGSFTTSGIIGVVALLVILSGVFLPSVDYYGRKRRGADQEPGDEQGWFYPSPFEPSPYDQRRYRPGPTGAQGGAEWSYPPSTGSYQPPAYGSSQPPAYAPRPPQAPNPGWPNPGQYDIDHGQSPYDEQWDQGQEGWGPPPRR
jgi:hypothetical protein